MTGETGRGREESIALSPQQHIVQAPVDSPFSLTGGSPLKKTSAAVEIHQQEQEVLMLSSLTCLCFDYSAEISDSCVFSQDVDVSEILNAGKAFFFWEEAGTRRCRRKGPSFFFPKHHRAFVLNPNLCFSSASEIQMNS